MNRRFHNFQYIEELPESTIFVFGSNLAGRHGAGAALTAATYFGAIKGQGDGIQGQSYAIPTKDYNLKTLPLDAINEHVKNFILKSRWFNSFEGFEFLVTRIGCGLAGYKDSDIAPMFKNCGSFCILPEEWRQYYE